MRRRAHRAVAPRSVVTAVPDRLGLALSSLHRLPPLQLLEDRRLFHPERAVRPALSFYRDAGRVIVSKGVSSPQRLRNDISSRIGFSVPKHVAVCIRRKERKEVIHAIGKAGRGGRVSSRRRRNYWSGVDC